MISASTRDRRAWKLKGPRQIRVDWRIRFREKESSNGVGKSSATLFYFSVSDSAVALFCCPSKALRLLISSFSPFFSWNIYTFPATPFSLKIRSHAWEFDIDFCSFRNRSNGWPVWTVLDLVLFTVGDLFRTIYVKESSTIVYSRQYRFIIVIMNSKSAIYCIIYCNIYCKFYV